LNISGRKRKQYLGRMTGLQRRILSYRGPSCKGGKRPEERTAGFRLSDGRKYNKDGEENSELLSERPVYVPERKRGGGGGKFPAAG